MILVGPFHSVIHNKASDFTCQPPSEIIHLPDHHPLLGGFPSINYCFFHSFKCLSVSISCDAHKSLVYTFPKAMLLLKLSYVRKFVYKEYQRVIKDTCWLCSVLGSLQAPSLRQEASLSYKNLSRCFSWISSLVVWILGHKLCVFLVCIDGLTFKMYWLFIKSRHSVSVDFLSFSSGCCIDSSCRENQQSFSSSSSMEVSVLW